MNRSAELRAFRRAKIQAGRGEIAPAGIGLFRKGSPTTVERLNDWGAATGGAWKGLFASVLLHAAAAAALLLTMSVAPQTRAPLVVDLTLDGPEGEAPARESRRAMAPPRPEAPATVRPTPAPAAPMPAPGPRSAQPANPAPATAFPSLPAMRMESPAPAAPGAGSAERPLPAPGPAGASGESEPARTPGVSTSRAAPGNGEAGGARTIAPGGSPARDFAYIRDAIQRGIAYPPMARKMGWEGKVVIAFLVLSDGSVRDVRVVQGSGYPALDRGAVDAVRKAAPFPKPPAEAEIITPVVYRLE